VTYPGSGGPWQPNDPNQQPGGYPPPQGYPQPGYQQQPGYQPQYPQTGPQPQQGYPQPQGYPPAGPQPQQGYYQQQGFPQTGPQPTQQYPGYGTPPPGFPQPKKSRKGLIIGAVVAVIAIAAGSVVTVMALNRSDTKAGAPNPTAAADSLVKAIGQGDVVGLLASLAPAESSILVDLQKDMTKELQRLEVYKKDADPNKLPGTDIKAENLTYDDNAAEKVNDHLTITKLTGGKLTIDSDLSKLPLTDKFIETLFPRGLKAKPQHQEIDIADFIKKENRGKPIRIATVKSGDNWYPSLFYTIADYALQSGKKSWPKQGIANKGASSPEQAVQEMAQAASEANLERVIELLPPDEMGALHDAGPVLLDEIGSPKGADIKINKFQGDTQDVSGGKKVVIKEVSLTVEGQDITVRRDGDCYSYDAGDQKEQFCADELAQQLAGKRLSPDAKNALVHLASGMLKNTGVVTTNVDGKWYVSPLRSFTDIELTVLKSLDAKDAYALVKMLK
jgi:hypothetical protein